MRTATVSAAALGGWRDAMLGCGLDPVRLTREVDIDDSAWADPSAQITLKSFVSFSEQVGSQPGHIALPWLVGENYDFSLMGEIGAAVLSATKLGTALRRFADHFVLLQDATELRLTVSDDVATVSYRILDPDIWPRHHDAMFTLAAIARIIKSAVGIEWEQAEIAFEAHACEPRSDFQKVTGTQCSFGADANQIRLPLVFLGLPMSPIAEPVDLRSLSEQLIAKRRGMPTADRVAARIFAELGEGLPSQSELAGQMGMSSRTLRRRLAEEGLSFQHILDDCMMRQAALDLRTRPELSIAQIALRLGYAEHSTFTRAFSRWSGMAPLDFRRRAVASHLN